MKVLILAGGLGTRLSEETVIKPKPMVEIGGKPILWHIMKTYSHYGFNEFVILLGYKGYLIKEYFSNYFMHQSDVTIDLQKNTMDIHNNSSEPWKITLIDTGEDTQTGGRLLKAQKYVDNETFMLTYGDGVSDVNVSSLLKYHHEKGGIATMTSVLPEGRYGAVDSTDDGKITGFVEKPRADGQWINGGFFVFEPEIFEYLRNGDQTALELAPLEELAFSDNFYAYRHEGFWKCMDSLRDKNQLEDLWKNSAPWKVWDA